MRKKICFLLPPIVLAIVTLIWYFCQDGRWYHYRDELLYGPLLILHLLIPVFYFVAFIVSVIRQIKKDTRSSSNIFYIAVSIVLSMLCSGGLILFLIFTGGL